MSTTKENFIQRYNDQKQQVIWAMEMALERAIGNEALDFEKMNDNYADVYPLIAAVLQNETCDCLEGSLNDARVQQMKRMTARYRGDLRIWRSYAGDYKDKQNNK